MFIHLNFEDNSQVATVSIKFYCFTELRISFLSFIREFVHSLSERVKCANERLGLDQRYAI